jgi:hypothetical protein
MHLKEIGQEGVDKNYLAEDRDQWWNIVNILKPSGPIKCREVLDLLGNC